MESINFHFLKIRATKRDRIVAFLIGLNERVNELRLLQAESQMELDALLPFMLDKAFVEEL